MSTIVRAARLARRFPPSRTKVRLGRALGLGLSTVGAAAICRTTMIDGTVLELDARDRTEAEALWNGAYESDYQHILATLVDQTGGVVYDVGANVGLMSVPLGRHFQDRGQVFCFEPVPENAARLRRNIELNGLNNCRVVEVALGEKPGTVDIAREVSHGSTSGNAVLVSEAPNLPRYDAITTVRLDTLDTLVTEGDMPLPDVVKLDVEGAEIGFFAGAQRTLCEARPVILGEFNSGLMPRFGTSFPDVVALLPPDYVIFGFVNTETIEEKEAAPGVGDVLLVPRERIADLPLQIRR